MPICSARSLTTEIAHAHKAIIKGSSQVLIVKVIIIDALVAAFIAQEGCA